MTILFSNATDYYACKGFNLDQVAREARDKTDGFAAANTLVAVGLSGALVVPHLAVTFGKHACIIRKSNEMTLSHNHYVGDVGEEKAALVGTIGTRWVFVDDFVGMGTTRQRALDIVSKVAPDSTYMGSFLYGCGLQSTAIWFPEAEA